MNDQRPGFYKGSDGQWHEDRRSQPDRRKYHSSPKHPDRRMAGRRRADAAVRNREMKLEIEEALADLESGRDEEEK
ncbi:MAG: hypothetical protein KJ052_07100 [Candidatus Hydrogenedentes bacterium]|nr:hypothetical protein [Candidatus Hydrogenedentota bacterium]